MSSDHPDDRSGYEQSYQQQGTPGGWASADGSGYPVDQPSFGYGSPGAPPSDPYAGQQGYGYQGPSGYPATPGYPGYPAYPAYPAAPTSYPGKTLGLVGLILSCVGLVVTGLSLVGLVLSIVGMVQSKNAGQKNGLALAGVIVGAALTVLGVAAVIVYLVILIPLIQAQR